MREHPSTQPADAATPPLALPGTGTATENLAPSGGSGGGGGDAGGTPPRAAPALPQIPGYAIEAELGHGAMGVVYRALQLGLDRTVALKMILKADFASAEQKLRFQIEAENAARVQHPNIVQVFEIGEHQGQPYFALEFVEGGALADWLKSNQTSPAEAAAFIETLARAIHAAHLQGIVHRDLKPANILLGEPAASADALNPKIADFGLAKREGSAHDLTDSGDVMGTPSYMSPEQARGDAKHVGPAADQFALGVIFYQLLTHRLPFRAATTPALLRQIAEAEPMAPRKRNPAVPLDLEVICLKALAKEPSRRYPSAEALAEDLKNWREHRPIVARPATRAERAAKWCRRYPAVAALIVVSVLAALIASGLAAWAMAAERTAAANETQALTERDLKEAQRRRAERNEQEARQKAAETQAILDFVQEHVFSAARPRDQEGGLGRDVKLAEAIQRALPLVGKSFPDQPAIEARLRTAIGKTLSYLGDLKAAAEQFERAQALLLKLHGPDHPDRLMSLSNLAVGLDALGRHAEALRLREEVAARRRARHEPTHRETLKSMHNLAVSNEALGRHAEALKLSQETLALQETHLGADDVDTLLSMKFLAVVLQALDRDAEALQLREKVLALRRVKLGPYHPDTLRSMNDLANSRYAVGQRDEALRLYEETLALQKTQLGADHPDTLQSMHNLAITWHALGKLSQALELREQTLALRRKRLGFDHPSTLRSMQTLAISYAAFGRHAEAIALLEAAVPLMEANLAPDHSDTLLSMSNMAFSCQALGRHADALTLRAEVAARRRAKLGADHPDTLSAMHHQARSLQALDRHDEAVKLRAEIWTLQKAKHGPDHPAAVTALANLAGSCRRAGRLSDAVPLFEQAAAAVAQQGFKHEFAESILHQAIETYEAAERTADAERWRRQWLAQVRKQAGADSLACAAEAAGLGRNLLQQKKWTEAESVLREAIAIREAKEPDAWTTFDTKSLLGGARLGQKKYAEAEPLLVAGYEGMKQRVDRIPASRKVRLAEAAERLLALFEATGRTSEVEKLRPELLQWRMPPLPPAR